MLSAHNLVANAVVALHLNRGLPRSAVYDLSTVRQLVRNFKKDVPGQPF
jgi:hypothetical protein